MTSLELISLITWICAVLGIILLLLCLILAVIFVYLTCRKHFFPGVQHYEVVPRADGVHATLENGHVVHKNVRSLSDANGSERVELTNEFGTREERRSFRKEGPVKKKLLWKKGRKKSFEPGGANEEADELNFSQDDFDIPRDGAGMKKPLFKKKHETVVTFKPRSKSDWAIHSLSSNTPIHSSEEDFNLDAANHLLLKPLQQEEVGKSQYFDALDTIQESMEEEEEKEGIGKALPLKPNNKEEDDEWEDLPGLDGMAEEKLPMQRFLQQKSGTEQGRSCRNHPLVKRRTKALKRLLYETKKVEEGFYQDLAKIEEKYRIHKLQPLYDSRKHLISGNANDPDAESHIPGFWKHAMLNCDTLRDIVQDHDHPVLDSLVDVRVVATIPADALKTKSLSRFRLEFEFEPNEFFANLVLTKDYDVRCEADPINPFAFEGPEIVNCKGCKLQWKKGRNVTLRPVKKLSSSGQVSHKWAKRNSFFNFFTPPKLSPKDTFFDIRKTMLMDAHFEIGLFIKEVFVPKATLFFLGELGHLRSHMGSIVASSRRGSKYEVSSARKRRRKRASETRGAEQQKEVDDVEPLAGDNQNVATLAQNGLDFTMSDVLHSQTSNFVEDPQSDTTPAGILPSSAQPDPILGSYRMTSSEGFDEYMKALGVGYVKRKLGNSVIPVNVILIDTDGTYTIRTETTVRNSEIQFKLGESFAETTLDGRITQTTVTREGNKLTLVQKGDTLRKEKNTLMTRDFQGDTMYMELIVGDIVCKRIYERI